MLEKDQVKQVNIGDSLCVVNALLKDFSPHLVVSDICLLNCAIVAFTQASRCIREVINGSVILVKTKRFIFYL